MTDCENFFWHEHQVERTQILRDELSCIAESYGYCRGCSQNFNISARRSHFVYQCHSCQMTWHTSCVPTSPDDIDHPCHPKHPLELLFQGPPTYSDMKCNLCQQKLSNFVYHCKFCDFSIDMKCAKYPPPISVDHPKCHEHTLTLMVRDVSFTCSACGTHGERNPYVCLLCSLVFHYECVDRPHVININRHEHRVSHACSLTPGNQECEICHQHINWRYGAYSCNKCPDYFVHSKCATRKDVWDGVELDGAPEEEVDNAPFKEIEEGVIIHFSHEEHNLYLVEDVLIDGGEAMLCEACCRPISFDKYYKCMECDFMLHEDCANLPLRKRHLLSTRILSLSTGKNEDNISFICVACSRGGTGFRYSEGDIELDVHCASLFWFRHPKLHAHTLFLTTLERYDCMGCDKAATYVLSCTECDYSLCFSCATLPVVINHPCDDHYLFLTSGEKAAGKYWCEICEAEIANPEKWFYKCYECGVVCHIDCVTGDSLNIKPGLLSMGEESKITVILNDQDARPLCSSCGSRCRFPMFYKFSYETTKGLYCSIDCIREYFDAPKSSEASP